MTHVYDLVWRPTSCFVEDITQWCIVKTLTFFFNCRMHAIAFHVGMPALQKIVCDDFEMCVLDGIEEHCSHILVSILSPNVLENSDTSSTISDKSFNHLKWHVPISLLPYFPSALDQQYSSLLHLVGPDCIYIDGRHKACGCNIFKNVHCLGSVAHFANQKKPRQKSPFQQLPWPCPLLWHLEPLFFRMRWASYSSLKFSFCSPDNWSHFVHFAHWSFLFIITAFLGNEMMLLGHNQ